MVSVHNDRYVGTVGGIVSQLPIGVVSPARDTVVIENRTDMLLSHVD